ncbi:MAG: hypothetical protein H6696_12335 [Deferribacteres bacterium]|nr:hypothetical protein [candidate division KSB1 bacterium]MCB9502714.1 hypothetical protein [Deferribacteres bacterium]
MAKVKQKANAKNTGKITFTKTNYTIFAIGLIFLIAGYIALAQGPATSYLSVSVAPILLVFGYCVIIPLAILYRNAEENKNLKQGD